MCAELADDLAAEFDVQVDQLVAQQNIQLLQYLELLRVWYAWQISPLRCRVFSLFFFRVSLKEVGTFPHGASLAILLWFRFETLRRHSGLRV